jgi:hypothetical protein
MDRQGVKCLFHGVKGIFDGVKGIIGGEKSILRLTYILLRYQPYLFLRLTDDSASANVELWEILTSENKKLPRPRKFFASHVITSLQ